MKILYHILYPEGMGDDRFTYDGYYDAFTDLGHTMIALTGNDDIVETFNRVQPDLFIGEGNFLMSDFARQAALLKQFRARGGRVVLHGAMSDWLAQEIRREPMIDHYFSEIDPTEEFPNFPSSLFTRMHWLAASRRYHFPAAPVERYRCDILYIGARLPNKEDAFRRLLLPLRQRYAVRIYGGDWDWLDRYLLHPLSWVERKLKLKGKQFFSRLRLNRQVPISDENKAYASAKICLNITESHPGTSLKTINARTFKIPASGGFEISDYVPQIREYFSEDEIVMPTSDEQWFELIEYYLKHDKERKEIQQKATAKALREHTFHNRVQTILRRL